MVNDSKKLYTLIGNPVKYSVSPAMHNAAFLKLNINAEYVKPIEVQTIRDLNLNFGEYVKEYQGLNITFPYKKDIFECIDRDNNSEAAKLIGAVNTVKIENEIPYGYNTDGVGFTRAFREKFGKSLKGRSMTIVGCGGAGSAVAVQAALEGVTTFVLVDKDRGSFTSLDSKIKKVNKNIVIKCYPPEGDELLTEFTNELFDGFKHIKAIQNTEIFVDATPLGMKTNDPIGMKTNEQKSVLEECIRKDHIVCDLVYNPAETPLLKIAKEKGADFMNGLGMLLYQGVEAFEIWTGQKAPVEVMREALRKKVYGG